MTEHEDLEPCGYKQSTCPCCKGIKTEIIYQKRYEEKPQTLPKKCECAQ